MDINRAVYGRKLTNIPELILLCMKEWAKIPPIICAGPINQKCLVAGFTKSKILANK